MIATTGIVDDARERTIVLFVCFIAIFIDGAAGPATAGALAQMGHTFALDPHAAAWLSIAFDVAYNLGVLLSLWLIGQHGKRGYFRGSLLGYGTALVAGALAPAAGIEIAARVVQGACLGGLFASALLTMVGISPPKQLPLVFAVFTLISLAAPSLGPLVAGLVLHAGGWRTVFGLFAIVPLAGGTVAGRFMKDVDPPRALFFDTASFGSVAIVLLALFYVTSRWAPLGFADGTVSSVAVIGAIALGWFLYRDFVLARNPFVDVSPLRNAPVARGIAACGLLGIVLGATASLVMFGGDVLGLDPLAATAVAAARFLGAIGGAYAMFAFKTRTIIDDRGASLTGLGAIALSFALQAVLAATNAPLAEHVLVAILQGFGLALALGPFASLLFGSVPREQFGPLALLFKIALSIGSAIAIPLMASTLVHGPAAALSYAWFWFACAILSAAIAAIVTTVRFRSSVASTP